MSKTGTKQKPNFKLIANQMMEHFQDIDYRYVGGIGIAQANVSAHQIKKWCDALNYPYPEGTLEAIRDANE